MLPIIAIVVAFFGLKHCRAGEPPNIVLFISDDLGRLDTSVHGSPDAKTPTLDKLAVQGMTFENAYVASPSCCPNRYSLLTGLMPARHGAHPNHSQTKPGTKLLVPLLKDLGYYVASFGKVAHRRERFAGCDYFSPRPVGMAQSIRSHFSQTDIDQPICLLVGDRRPHVPWIEKSEYDPAKVTLPEHFIDTPETREHWARYLTDITGMDRELGHVWDFAQERLGENTIIMFTSDHGGQWPFGKWNLYDAGTRVPLIAIWPEHINAGVRTDAMVSWIDILPTLIDLAGGMVPQGLDGDSFAKVLLGNAPEHREQIFTTHTGDGPMNIFPMRSIRRGQFKYIHNLRPETYHTNHSDRHRKDGAGAYWDSWDAAAERDPRAAAIVKRYYTRPEFELFDLQADPHEQENLADAGSHQEILEELRQELKDWTTAQGDDLQPHREPYPTSRPLPHLPPRPRKR